MRWRRRREQPKSFGGADADRRPVDAARDNRFRFASVEEDRLTGPCLACGHRARMYSVEEMVVLNRIRWKLPPGHPLQIRGCPHGRGDCPLLTRGPISGARPPRDLGGDERL